MSMNATAPHEEESTEVLTVLGEELSFAWHIILCAAYICWWRIKHYIWYDSKVNRGAKVIIAISALALLPESLLFISPRHAIFAKYVIFTRLVAIFEKYIPPWLGPSAFVLLLLTAALLTMHKVAEAAKTKKERSFADHVGPLFDALTELKIAHDDHDKALTDFVAKVLSQVHDDFARAKRDSLTVNVMSRHPDGKLRIAYLYPVGTRYDPNICFEPGKGGAGYSYAQNAIVYVPSIRHMHGILVRVSRSNGKTNISYGLKRRVYLPIADELEVFESFLCLPVISLRGETHAVMNVDSKTRDGFDMEDVHVLRAYARMLGDGISICS
jgi:hypothetical protein